MSDKLEKLVEELSTLTVLEAADLVKKLEEKWGVSAAAPVAMAMPGAAAAAAEPVEEKSGCDSCGIYRRESKGFGWHPRQDP